MVDHNGIYYNKFFDEHGDNQTFQENKKVGNLTRRDIWESPEDVSKFYFLPFLMNCYKFTRKQKLPYFTLMCSPTMVIYRDQLHKRSFLDTIHQVFFKTMDMCGVLHQPIMLLVEKRFHITQPIDGGSQQLYNMLWDQDLRPTPINCHLPMMDDEQLSRSTAINPTSYNPPKVKPVYDPKWKKHRTEFFNPDMPKDGLWLSRGTLWLQDDLNFLCKQFILDDEYTQCDSTGQFSRDLDSTKCGLYDIDIDRLGEHNSTEVLDFENVPEGKIEIYEKTAREFYFKVFQPKEYEDDDEMVSSDSDLIDSTIDDFDPIDGSGQLDSTLDFEEDEEEMKKILAFFANMTKVTGLVQGMLDIITSLTRILPLVADKLDKPEDATLKDALVRILGILNKGSDKVLKICGFLGIKIEKKQSGAMAVLVKNRFKKNKGEKKDFLEYEIGELNKTLDYLENVDTMPPPPNHGKIPYEMTYPQRMEMGKPIGMPPPPNPVHDFLAGYEPPPPPPKKDNPPPPQPPIPDPSELDSSKSELIPPKPPIPSIMPEPPKDPPKDVNGIK